MLTWNESNKISWLLLSLREKINTKKCYVDESRISVEFILNSLTITVLPRLFGYCDEIVADEKSLSREYILGNLCKIINEFKKGEERLKKENFFKEEILLAEKAISYIKEMYFYDTFDKVVVEFKKGEDRLNKENFSREEIEMVKSAIEQFKLFLSEL